MVAYSFKSRFAVAIREGWKTQTIRTNRKRHARVGEMLQMFTGMRTAQCRKICEDVRCTEVLQVEICFGDDGGIDRIDIDGAPVRDLDAFAVLDGFANSDDMSAFWRAEHGPREVFYGTLIEWAAPRAEMAIP